MLAEAQNENDLLGASGTHQNGESRRERSSIEFPYANLEDAERVAANVFEHAGMSEISVPQLAAALKISSASSTIRVFISTAKMFGLISPERGVLRLSELGRAITHPETQQQARVQAFLSVPLYKAITSQYDGRTLPPPAALEKEMGELGVAPKQTVRARQAFERSARHAGFTRAGSDRFSTPIVNKGTSFTERDGGTDKPHLGGRGGSGGGGQRGADHLIIQGLVQELPDVGSTWEPQDRVNWLRLAENAFNLIYKGTGRIKIDLES